MPQYYIYHKDSAPEALIAKHPNHAIYAEGDLFLFCQSLEEVTGVASPDEDVFSFSGGDTDEDFMADAVEEDVLILNKEERIAARIAARIQARVDARIALRVAQRKAIRVADRRELRYNARQGKKLYNDWVALQDSGE